MCQRELFLKELNLKVCLGSNIEKLERWVSVSSLRAGSLILRAASKIKKQSVKNGGDVISTSGTRKKPCGSNLDKLRGNPGREVGLQWMGGGMKKND